MTTYRICKTYSVVMGIFLLTQGIWSFINPMIFGVFTGNIIAAIVNIILGITGIWFGNFRSSRMYNLLLGILLLGISSLWYIDGSEGIIKQLLNVNEPVIYLNTIAGSVALLLGIITPRRKHEYNVALLF